MPDNDKEVQLEASAAVDEDKMAALKAKMAAKQAEQPKMGSEPAKKSEKSINFGVVGSGQFGGRICAECWKLGYNGIAINTASQDLKFIDIPESNKLLLDYGLGGAAKSLEFGNEAAEQYREQITTLINKQFADAQAIILTFSAGGGSGAGSADVLIDILSKFGKPVVVLTNLPMASDDPNTKSNTLETLGKLTKYLQTKTIANLFVIDNAKLESIYSDVGQMDFFQVANKAIVEPIDAFNTFSLMPSNSKGLDPMEWSKLMFDGEGLSIYASMKVSNYQEDTAIAEAVVSHLDANLLATGFDISEAKYVGFMVCAPASVWKQIPASSINYAMAVVNDVCKAPHAVYKGIYTVEDGSNEITVYTMLSGLSLPKERIDGLAEETRQYAEAAKTKDASRNLNLTLPTIGSSPLSAAQKVKDKIAGSKSNFSKFTSQVTDRRNK